jgi:hypothetical protein
MVYPYRPRLILISIGLLVELKKALGVAGYNERKPDSIIASLGGTIMAWIICCLLIF